jgi:serine protease Do
MKRKILIVFLISIFLAIAANADNLTLNSNADTLGFSSDDSGGTSYLGVDTRDITTDRLAALHLKEERGVEVTMVDQDAPAGKAGLKEQDVILTMNGTEVESVEQFRRLIRETPPGRVITLGISRKGQPMNVKVQLADRKNGFAYGWSNTPEANNFHFEMPTMPAIPDLDIDIPVSVVVVHSSMRSGLMVENLTPQLGDFFGAKNGQGVLVRSVEKGSRADKAGFHAGDVIVKINGEAVSDSGDFSRALHSRKDNKVSISILRDRKEQTITLTLPERRQGDLYWESFDAPQIDAKTQEELSKLQSEIARMRPQMDEAYSRSMAEFGKNWAKQAQEMRKQGDELRKQMREWQRQYTDQQDQSMEKLRKEFQHMENEF